jgi:6-hydroxynicotinate 3-monooxygenase
MIKDIRIAIIGAGMGGLALASALSRLGIQAKVFEQTKKFTRLGAGIQMSPNAVKALRGLGLEANVRRRGFQPENWANREANSGEMMFELRLGKEAEALYGAPYLQMHRADLHSALLEATPPDWLHLGHKLLAVDTTPSGLSLHFENAKSVEADLVIGADGLHSIIREILLGPSPLSATGRVAYRAVFPASLMPAPIGPCTKWWGEDRHIVLYYVSSKSDEVYFVTSLPDDDWKDESWSAEGDMTVVRKAFEHFHEEVRQALSACPHVHRWAIMDRPSLKQWHGNGIVLLGDAAHPMTPYMAQGAAMALEDAVVLARALAKSTNLGSALNTFQQKRSARTAKAQAVSQANTWMRAETDPAWCYGYDPWAEEL